MSVSRRAFSLTAAAAPLARPISLTERWSARWISVPNAPPAAYGVYHFRRTFDLPAKPERFLVHVSADNRYELFVNGARVVFGPARGDLFHWRYETVDLAAHLRPGRNVIAAVVWNHGPDRAIANWSHATAFLLQGDTKAEEIINTDAKWKCTTNAAYRPLTKTTGQMRGYFVVGPGDEVDAAKYPWGWEHPDYEDSAWPQAVAGSNASPRDSVDAPNHWMLVPRPIPLMEETPERLQRVRRAESCTPPAAWPAQPAPFTIPANQRATILLDRNQLTTAFPELIVSGGRGARVTLRYCEAFFVPNTGEKKNRDEFEGLEMRAYEDAFISDGGRSRLFRPLFWRTFRYLELKIETQSEPLTLDDLRCVYTGYPFTVKAKYDDGQDVSRRILEVGWRTARLCAHDTYMDCPFYEQLQYAGDTRIQCLVSLYMSGDARLMRNAIEQLDSSRVADAPTYSRAPSALQQYIPGFALWWIGMVHDYWMYTEDTAFVRSMLPGVRAVIDWFQRFQHPDGSLKRIPWWNYMDWVREWPRGMPPLEADGRSILNDCQLILALDEAAQLEEALGRKMLAMEHRAAASKIRLLARRQYWSAERGLYADTPAKQKWSQHAQALAVLARVAFGPETKPLMEKALTAQGLAQCSIYFRYYLHRACVVAGLGDRYMDLLDEWRQMLAAGLTTWAEQGVFRTRSDCHAWGSSPNIEFFRTVLGIDSGAPGWSRVRITPHPGKLEAVSGAIPHPKGLVEVSLKKGKEAWEVQVAVPEGIGGELVWRGRVYPLRSASTRLVLA